MLKGHNSTGCKLFIVEGLTGSGKSTLAHYLARQLQYNGFRANWVHEGEIPHPILMDLETSIEDYMAKMLERWAAFTQTVALSADVQVVEACTFNNLIETLLAYHVDAAEIYEFSEKLQKLLEPLNPTLIYLMQEDIENALERTFKARGNGFREFVIRYTDNLPIARVNEWKGYEGMILFWQEFVALTDELFQRYRFRKLKIDISAGNWDECNRQVLEGLAIPYVPERWVSHKEAMNLVGVYKARNGGKEYTIRYEYGGLTVNLFLETRTKLIQQTREVYLAAGWHFTFIFEVDDSSQVKVMRIEGKDVDYLRLVGTIADKLDA